MRRSNDLHDFVRRCNAAQSEELLFALLDEETKRLGFRQFAMTHHVDLSARPEDCIAMASYDSNWIETLIERRYYLDDPIHAASSRTGAGFLWSEVPKMIEINDRHRTILNEAAKFGLAEGFTVPVHVPGEYRGTCSFGAEDLDKVAPDGLAKAQLVGTFAFEAARRIIRARVRGDTKVPELTSRQLDCVTLVAMGKTDWEIGRILGISEATAHEHIEAARRRYDVAKRTQLVIRALYDGQITFSDILH